MAINEFPIVTAALADSKAVSMNDLFALRFDSDIKSKLYAGQMYKSGVNLDTAWLEYIYKVRAGGQYIISVDDGGAHVWLVGHLVSSGRSQMAGNISFYDTDGAGAQHNVDIAGFDAVDEETWHHFGLAVDHTWSIITPFLDGVAGKDIAIPAGYRRRIGNTGWGECHIGGSHHQNANGDLLQMAIYEGALPFATGVRPGSFKPSRVFGYSTQNDANDYVSPNMCWYMGFPTGRVVPDIGSGYNDVKHNAVFHADDDSSGSYQGSYGTLRHATAIPEWIRVTDFAKPTYQGAAHATPSGAVVSDSFSRDDSTPFWDEEFSLGTAPTGQAWENDNGVFGIIDGCAYCGVFGSQYRALIPTGIAASGGYVNMRVEGTRKVATAAGGDIGIVARATDQSNYIFLKSDVAHERAFLYKVVAGTPTLLEQIDGIGDTWSKIVIDGFGSSLRIYVDSTLEHTETGVTDNATGAKAGIYGEGFMRLARFDVHPVTS